MREQQNLQDVVKKILKDAGNGVMRCSFTTSLQLKSGDERVEILHVVDQMVKEGKIAKIGGQYWEVALLQQ